jgi:hypothetical protein
MEIPKVSDLRKLANRTNRVNDTFGVGVIGPNTWPLFFARAADSAGYMIEKLGRMVRRGWKSRWRFPTVYLLNQAGSLAEQLLRALSDLRGLKGVSPIFSIACAVT